MQIINRDALRVTPKKPLIDWVNSIDPVHPVQFRDATHHDASTTYLIEELDSQEDFQEWIKENYVEIFEQELFSWIMDDSQWPEPLTYELFTEWIEVSWNSMVFDLNDSDPIEYEEE